jgi:molecular chaperone HscC
VQDVFVPILERGTVIPTSRVERFSMAADGERQIRVEVFQGEYPICAQNTCLGHYVVKDIPEAPAGQQSIDVRFTYDLNGLLEVDMSLVSSGKTESFLIVQRPGALSPEDLVKAREALARLKMHPRDAFPNTTALARAEVAFVDLTGEPRRMLGAAIGNFRAALEQQSPKTIEELRTSLVALTQRLLGT